MDLGQKPEIIVKIEIKADREAKREDGGKCGPGAVVPRAQCVAEIRVLGSIVLDQGPGLQVGVVGKMHGPWDA